MGSYERKTRKIHSSILGPGVRLLVRNLETFLEQALADDKENNRNRRRRRSKTKGAEYHATTDADDSGTDEKYPDVVFAECGSPQWSDTDRLMIERIKT